MKIIKFMKKKIATLEFNISKSEFIEKLKAITLEYSIDSINQINRKNPGKWIKHTIKRDYNELNKNFALEQDIFHDLQIPEATVFAGEFRDTEINLFVIAKKLFSKDPSNLTKDEKLIALILKLQNNLDSNDNKLFYYRIEIKDLNEKIEVNIYKNKFEGIFDRLQATLIPSISQKHLITMIIFNYNPPLFFLAIVYFVEEFLYKSHNIFKMIVVQVLIATLIWACIDSGYKVQKEAKRIREYQKDLDDIFILLLQQAITV